MTRRPMLPRRPHSDDHPHQDWMCKVCGEMNSGFDNECVFCDDEAERRRDYLIDHMIDQRKHSR